MIGEKVLVGFEGRNAEKPVVLGTQYNGKEVSGFHTRGNDQKVIQTRSGTKIVMNDAAGSVFIEDPSGNCVFLDGQGNIKVDAPNDITLNAGNNMDVNVGNNMTFNVGNSMEFTVVNQAIFNILNKMVVNTPVLTQIITDLLYTTAGKALISSKNEIKIESPEMYLAGQRKLFLHSDDSTIINSQNIVEVKGKSGNKSSNIADTYEVAIAPLEAKCVVYFRPLNNWAGSFGFDWIRQKDTHPVLMEGDFLYKDFTGSTLPTNVFAADAAKFNLLKSLYDPYTIPWKVDAVGIAAEYYTPWIALFPENTLEVFIDDEPDYLGEKKAKKYP